MAIIQWVDWADHLPNAEVVEEDIQSDKVTAIRYKAKKRVHKENGHRQKYSRIEVTSIK